MTFLLNFIRVRFLSAFQKARVYTMSQGQILFKKKEKSSKSNLNFLLTGPGSISTRESFLTKSNFAIRKRTLNRPSLDSDEPF